METAIFKLMQAENRKTAIKAGFYDGRFKSRVMPNKKRTAYLKLRKSKKVEY